MRLRSIFFLISGIFLTYPAYGETDNACIGCHQSLIPSHTPTHSFAEWQNSIHAQKGVSCEKCHGGNPLDKDPQKAHQGVLKGGRKESPLYFSNIPETCGKCHAPELAEFKKSFHYRELKRSGQGPNCLTCHGSMATHILKPKELDQSCSLCHAERKSANQALVTLNQAGSSLKRLEEMTQKGKEKGKTTLADEKILAEMKKAYQQVQQEWHSFRMQEVIQQAKEIVTTSQREIQKLKLKGI